jgi:2-keto-4-pentenoate hydratase/2-oxohepta-3-ene-1,7-dioic acid hydratase in catechol pathway
MLRGVADLIEQASRWMTLERGDLLFTGTPAGVGPLVAGDRVTARIATVGELEIEIEVEDES